MVKLWVDGARVLVAHHESTSAADFFYHLRFVDCFPEVTHWWMRSQWAGRVRVSAPVASDGEGIMGVMQFDSEDAPALPWMVDDGAPIKVAVPLPPGDHSACLFLQLRLAQLVTGALGGAEKVDAWVSVTSHVVRDQLFELLSVTHQAPSCWLPIRLAALVGNADPHSRGLQHRRWTLADKVDLPCRRLFVGQFEG